MTDAPTPKPPLADEEVRALLADADESIAARDATGLPTLSQWPSVVARLCRALLESRATVSALEQRVAELEEKSKLGTCVHCGYVGTKTPEDIVAHVLECERHPLGAAMRNEEAAIERACDLSATVQRVYEEAERIIWELAEDPAPYHKRMVRALTPGPDTGGHK